MKPKAQVETFGLAAWSGEPGPMAQAHRHNDVELNFVLRGGLHYLFAGREVRLAAGHLGLFWGAIPHRLAGFKPGTQLIWVTLPLASLLRWGLPRGFTEALLGGGFLESEHPADPCCLPLWTEEISGGRASRAVLLELEARVWRAAQGFSPARQPPMPSSRAARMAAFLAEHHTRPVRPAEAAWMVGLNPNYAAGLFLRHFGMTPTDYLTALRVAHAQRLLLSSELGVLEVALESGFGSPSRFYAAFTRLVGESPGAFRRRLG